MSMDKRPDQQSGFTLMEMIISLTVLGLLSVVMLPMLSMPMTSYMEAQKRVDLQAQLDLVRAKLSDDLQYALPTSLRVQKVGTVCYLEYLEVRATGRYRNGSGGPGFCPNSGCNQGDGLGTSCAAETCVTTLGPLNLAQTGVPPVNGSDYVAIIAANSNPYAAVAASPLSRLTAQAAVTNGTGLTFAAHAFPAAGTSPRVYIVAQPVTYAFNEPSGHITKYWGYALSTAQPSAFAPAISNARLADTASGCDTRVSRVGARQVAAIKLKLTASTAGQPTESVEGFMQFGVREP